MRRWVFAGVGLLLAGTMQACSDRLADMQAELKGTWVLESRQLPDGTVLRAPEISGVFDWTPIDSRKAHVTLNVLVENGQESPRTFNYAASTYEISTSAITRKRYLLLRQGYRSSAETPITVYPKAQTKKGKISVEGEMIKISHEDGFSQEFRGNTMLSVYPEAYTDTWKRKP